MAQRACRVPCRVCHTCPGRARHPTNHLSGRVGRGQRCINGGQGRCRLLCAHPCPAPSRSHCPPLDGLLARVQCQVTSCSCVAATCRWSWLLAAVLGPQRPSRACLTPTSSASKSQSSCYAPARVISVAWRQTMLLSWHHCVA